LTSLS